MKWISQFSLENKVAIVTGAAGGLGSELVKIILDAGAFVVLADRDKTKLDEFSESLSIFKDKLLTHECDVTAEEDIHRLIAQTHQVFKNIDILINCAGILGQDASLFDVTGADWDSVINVNLKGTWMASTHVAQYMVAQHIEGSIINISSSLGLRSQLKRIHYATSKAGVEHLTRNLAMKLVRHKIRVNCLAPGWMNTEMVNNILSGTDAQKWRNSIPMGRAADPSELTGALLLLASKASSYMTGSIVRVDGGYAYSGIELPD